MRIVSISVTRNESEIIEAFVRHHCALFDEMLIIVHRCGDNTREILSSLAEEGLPVRITADTYCDGDIDGITPLPIPLALPKASSVLTDAMRDAAHRGADWVFPLDIDEFVAVPGRSALEELLAEANPASAVKMPWVTYVPTPQDDENEPHLLRRITHRRMGKLGPMESKICVPRIAALRENTVLSSGNHLLVDPVTMKLDRGQTIGGLGLAHFPVRDERQIRNRIISAYLFFKASPLGGQGWNEAQGKLWARCTHPTPISRNELQSIALSYHRNEPSSETSLINDPVTVLAPELRYPVRTLSTWDLLIENADHLAGQLGIYAKRQYEAAIKGLPPGQRTK